MPSSPHRHQQQQHGVGAGMSQEETEELRRDAAEYKSLAQAVSVEKDKLTELVGVLQKRWVGKRTGRLIDWLMSWFSDLLIDWLVDLVIY